MNTHSKVLGTNIQNEYFKKRLIICSVFETFYLFVDTFEHLTTIIRTLRNTFNNAMCFTLNVEIRFKNRCQPCTPSPKYQRNGALDSGNRQIIITNKNSNLTKRIALTLVHDSRCYSKSSVHVYPIHISCA